MSLSEPGAVSAAILAGGGSRRMGRNKALLPLPPDGKPMLAVIRDRVQLVTGDVMIIGPSFLEFADDHTRVIQEPVPGLGPLAGIATALTAAAHDTCVVVACDMPLLREGLLRLLVRLHMSGGADATVPRLDAGGDGAPSGWQPLCAVYDRRCLPAINRLLDAGERSLHALLEAIPVLAIPETELSTVDPDLASFVNTNDPADYARLLARLAEQS